MAEIILGNCRYCMAQVIVDDEKITGKGFVTCSHCREKLAITEFQNKQMEYKRALEEREKAKQDLEKAEETIKAEQEKVWKVISEMNGLKGSVKEQELQLKKILESSQIDRETQKTIIAYLRVMKNDQQQGQKSVFSVLDRIVAEQDTAQEKLSALQDVTAKLTEENADFLKAINEITGLLRADVEQKNQITVELFSWFNNRTEKEQDKLKQINTISMSLLSGQEKIGADIRDIRKKAEENQRAIESLGEQLEQSRVDELVNLYHQAENLQLDMAFEKAEDKYREVIVKGATDPEVYWRIVLCHYGVVYQKDNEGNRIPTVLRPDLSVQLTIIKDLEGSYRTAEERKYYSAELRRINDLLDKYRHCQMTAHYDVFISVKQKIHYNGQEAFTEDYKIGSDLYQHLTEKGLRVFNSEQENCKKPGEEWEPYILAALLSSRIMIVVGTSSENMKSQWVQNEWQRFQWLQAEEKKAGKTDRKLLCFIDNMTGSDLPQGLAPIQAIINKAGAYRQLDQVIAGCFPEINKVPEPWNKTDIDSVRERMRNWLAFKRFDLVQEEYQKVVSDGIYSLDVVITLYNICAEHKLTKVAKLETVSFDLEQEESIQIILENSRDQEALKQLREFLEKNRKNREKEKEIPAQPEKADSKTAGKSEPQKGPEKAARTPAVPVIRSLDLADKLGRLDKYLESLNIQREWIRDPGYPLASVFLSEYIGLLSVKIDYQAPLEGDYECIIWRVFSADGKPLTKQNISQQEIVPGKITSRILTLTYDKTWPVGEYTLHLTVNGSLPASLNFKIITIDSLKKEEPVQKDSPEWLRRNAEKGNAKAQFELGNRYKNGIGTEQNYAEAVKWFRKSAEQGNADAQCSMGIMYENGYGVRKDCKEAAKWYHLSAAQGQMVAQYNLGTFYQNGTGVVADSHEAFRWYEKSALQGYERAQNSLGLCYRTGNGVKQNYAEAVRWFRKSAEQGFAEAQCSMGIMYYNGYGVNRDFKEAVRWYKLSAAQEQTVAQNNLGVCYANGFGVGKDYQEAFKWYERSALHGNAMAQDNLGCYFENGTGVARNQAKAVEWYRKSAAQGNALAYNHLGLCYEFGKGVPKNLQEAIKWYQMGADAGQKYALANLGRCYENGIGVMKDLKEAAKWYQLGSAQGEQDSVSGLERIRKLSEKANEPVGTKQSKTEPGAPGSKPAGKTKKDTIHEKTEFWKKNLPHVYATFLAGNTLNEKAINNAVKRTGAVLRDEEVIALIEAKRGPFLGYVIVLITSRRMFIDTNEKVYPTLGVDFQNIQSVTATPMDTMKHKNQLNVEVRNGTKRVIAETEKTEKDTINYKELARAVNEYIQEFVAD